MHCLLGCGQGVLLHCVCVLGCVDALRVDGCVIRVCWVRVDGCGQGVDGCVCCVVRVEPLCLLSGSCLWVCLLC